MEIKKIWFSRLNLHAIFLNDYISI